MYEKMEMGKLLLYTSLKMITDDSQSRRERLRLKLQLDVIRDAVLRRYTTGIKLK